MAFYRSVLCLCKLSFTSKYKRSLKILFLVRLDYSIYRLTLTFFHVRGYREVNRELSVARSNWEQQQERARRSASQERAPPATFYKSVVGTR